MSNEPINFPQASRLNFEKYLTEGKLTDPNHAQNVEEAVLYSIVNALRADVHLFDIHVTEDDVQIVFDMVSLNEWNDRVEESSNAILRNRLLDATLREAQGR